jgi:hypothetical protein
MDQKDTIWTITSLKISKLTELINLAPHYKDLGHLALDGGEWSASRPGHFTIGEIDPGIHWIVGWVGPRAGLDTVE